MFCNAEIMVRLAVGCQRFIWRLLGNDGTQNIQICAKPARDLFDALSGPEDDDLGMECPGHKM